MLCISAALVNGCRAAGLNRTESTLIVGKGSSARTVRVKAGLSRSISAIRRSSVDGEYVHVAKSGSGLLVSTLYATPSSAGIVCTVHRCIDRQGADHTAMVVWDL
jgi:hypothetical protein